MLKIVIQTDADFTPAGKRRAMIVRTNSGHGPRVLRWYVGQRTYRTLPVTAEAVALTNEWLAAA